MTASTQRQNSGTPHDTSARTSTSLISTAPHSRRHTAEGSGSGASTVLTIPSLEQLVIRERGQGEEHAEPAEHTASEDAKPEQPMSDGERRAKAALAALPAMECKLDALPQGQKAAKLKFWVTEEDEPWQKYLAYLSCHREILDLHVQYPEPSPHQRTPGYKAKVERHTDRWIAAAQYERFRGWDWPAKVTEREGEAEVGPRNEVDQFAEEQMMPVAPEPRGKLERIKSQVQRARQGLKGRGRSKTTDQ